MKKLTDYDLYEVLKNDNDNGYCDFYRTSITKDGKKIYGTMFRVCRALKDSVKEELLKYPNTLLYISQAQYAPELKSNMVLLLDRKIR